MLPLRGRIGENDGMSRKAGKDKPNGGGTIALNKRARHEYSFEEKYEAGLALQGWELSRSAPAAPTSATPTRWCCRASCSWSARRSPR